MTKIYYLILIIFSIACATRPVAEKPIENDLSYDSTDQNISRDLAQEKDFPEFQKWRSNPPGYYQFISKKSELKAPFESKRKGLCAGDPHVENFGHLFVNNKQIFSINDLDDSSPCSLNADLMRLYVGNKLALRDWGITEPQKFTELFLKHYQSGLRHQSPSIPKFILSIKPAAKNLNDSPPFFLNLLNGCGSKYRDLTTEEKNLIVKNLGDKGTFLKGCSYVKNHGGSAGLKRFFVVYEDSSQNRRSYELKPLVIPSPVIRSLSSTERAKFYESAACTFLSDCKQEEYFTLTMGKTLYQRRPLNLGFSDVLMEKMTSSDLIPVMYFEAYILGFFHKKGSPSAEGFSFSSSDWEKFAEIILNEFHYSQK